MALVHTLDPGESQPYPSTDNTVHDCRRSAMLDVVFVALLVGLVALAVGFAVACDRLMGPDEPALSEAGREGAERTELESA
jgi:hypothetical protein